MACDHTGRLHNGCNVSLFPLPRHSMAQSLSVHSLRDSNCPTENDLIAFSAGEASHDCTKRIMIHLDDCTSCRQVVAAVTQASAEVSLSQAETRQPPLSAFASNLQHSLAAGHVLGRYTISHTLGQGAMGAVYAAHDPALDRTVAIKVLHNAFDGTAEQQARLVQEAKALAKINHPNVVAVHDVGFVDGNVFLAMEHVSGGTLRSWCNQRRPWRDIVNMYISAGQGLVAAHSVGVIHRDFKPENVLVDSDQRPRVSDFGLARATPRPGDQLDGTIQPTAVTHTQSGVMVGTPAYMAVEQFACEIADGKTDQFAFCVALFESLAGHRPFLGATLADLSAAVADGAHDWPKPSRIIPNAIRNAVSRGLAPHRNDRFADMQQLLTVLRKAMRRRQQLTVATVAAVSALALTATVASVSRAA
jgi:eukaryotic-like serine/threonine-protein kinase